MDEYDLDISNHDEDDDCYIMEGNSSIQFTNLEFLDQLMEEYEHKVGNATSTTCQEEEHSFVTFGRDSVCLQYNRNMRRSGPIESKQTVSQVRKGRRPRACCLEECDSIQLRQEVYKCAEGQPSSLNRSSRKSKRPVKQ
jgi:hypothetical protein